MAKKSPSTRRAWIEMNWKIYSLVVGIKSPSTRRAWIEITSIVSSALYMCVALHLKGAGRTQIVTLDFWT